MGLGKQIELTIQTVLFASRWLLAPFYVALAFAMVILMIKAGQHVVHLAHDSFRPTNRRSCSTRSA